MKNIELRIKESLEIKITTKFGALCGGDVFLRSVQSVWSPIAKGVYSNSVAPIHSQLTLNTRYGKH